MKRGRLLLFAFVLISIILVSMSLVAAQGGEVVEGIQKFFTPVLQAIFGSTAGVFEELLFALIIIAFVYMALSQIEALEDRPWVMWLIVLASAILSVRFIVTEGITKMLLFPQGVFAVAMLVIVPFVVYFWFVEFGLGGPENRVLRKVAWAVYAAVFIFLWVGQFYAPAHSEDFLMPWEGSEYYMTRQVPASIESWGYLYLLAAFIALVLLIWDGTIQGAIAKSKAQTHIDVIKEKEIAKIRRKMEEATRDLPPADAAKEIKKLSKELDVWRKR